LHSRLFVKNSAQPHATYCTTDVTIINKTPEAKQTEGVVVSQKRKIQQIDIPQQET